MGGCASAPEGTGEESQASKEIDNVIRKDKRNYQNEFKLLLLGAGESGKSTVAKQMKIIHLNGFSKKERQSYVSIIHANIMMSMRSLVIASRKLANACPFQNPEAAEMFTSRTVLLDSLTPELVKALKLLWQDPLIKQMFQRSNEFQLNDSAGYFFDNIDRIAKEGYVPTEQDVLRSRARTAGVSEMCFQVKSMNFRLVDVGGQRSERKKWLHCFEEVKAIIFCVALSEYNLKLWEDETVNRMDESLFLFEDICNYRYFQKTPLILFLNKSDLFEEKIKTVDLNVCFPSYTGGCDFNRSIAFIKKEFQGRCKDPNKQIFTHITCATNTDNIKFVFESVREFLAKASIEALGTTVS
mmetsp:Transcript_13445/g.34298  ORF Transcript_13445/g.34298 Transcript_13445/m.34298 type:complete len:355 (+) Transcript_13445:90-1154(+)